MFGGSITGTSPSHSLMIREKRSLTPTALQLDTCAADADTHLKSFSITAIGMFQRRIHIRIQGPEGSRRCLDQILPSRHRIILCLSATTAGPTSARDLSSARCGDAGGS